MRTLTLMAARTINRITSARPILTILFAILFQLYPLNIFASGNGTSVGLTLTEPTGARPASLGEAFTAVPDDIASMGYNPASLATLTSGDASFMYEKGIADDAYGQFMVGMPLQNSGMGLSVGYYNGGTMDVWTGSHNLSVTAKKDLTMNVGYARPLGRTNVGVSGKYISSTLVDEKTATAFALDMGVMIPLSGKVHAGAALQNIGTKMKYVTESNDLPQIGRVGFMYSPIPSLNLLLDAPYYMNESQLRPQLGAEYLVGPLAFRGGYQSKNGLNQFTFGAGFNMGKLSLDYAYGLVNDLEASHRASLSVRFGNEKGKSPALTKEETPPEMTKAEAKPGIQFVEQKVDPLKPTEAQLMQSRSLNNQIYEVKPGDTLGKIARAMYGDSGAWKRIYAANQHLLNDEKSIEVGQRIVLP